MFIGLMLKELSKDLEIEIKHSQKMGQNKQGSIGCEFFFSPHAIWKID